VTSFELSQTNGLILLEAIKIFLSLDPNVHTDKTNNSSLKVTSIDNIEKVIKFLQDTPVKLMGHKKVQYLNFLNELKKMPVYSNKFNVPEDY
jgi:hypothetical protein